MRIYLKPEFVEHVKNLRDKSGWRIWNVQTDSLCGHYILTSSYGQEMDYYYLANSGLEFSGELSCWIEKIVTQEHFVSKTAYLRGVYRHDGCTIVVDKAIFIERDGTTAVTLTASGPNIESLKNCYSLFRQKKLEPEENWDVP